MDSMLALTILFILFAVGDYVAAKTKAFISMVLLVAVALMICFWLKVLPLSIIKDSQLTSLGLISASLLITSMGTMLDFNELKQQWKTVMISTVSVFGIAVLVVPIGGPLIGKSLAIAASPIIAGGAAATIIMVAALKAKGMADVAVFVVLVYVFQKFVGVPVASALLNREGEKLVDRFRKNPAEFSEVLAASADSAKAEGTSEKNSKFRIFSPLPKEMQTPHVLLAKLGIVVVLSNQLAAMTNGVVSPFVLYLLLGVVGAEIGFLERDILKKANSMGWLLFVALVFVFSNLTQATPQMVLSLIVPLLISLGLGLVAIIIASMAMAKLLKVSFSMAIAIGTACLFGFPTTYYIPNEVANAVAQTDDEKKVVLNSILPKMLIAGFVSVSIASVLFAGLMVKFL